MCNRTSGWKRRACAAVTLMAAFDAALAQDVGLPGSSNVRIGNERAAGAVRRAVAGASERLKDPACNALLHRFRAASGRTLQENLEATGQSSEAYLTTRIFFYEGYKLPTCRTRRAKQGLAVTWPGNRAVYVCTTRFTDVEKRNPLEAQAIMIHEMLHTLGLGENPPTSNEITDMVTEACVK